MADRSHQSAAVNKVPLYWCGTWKDNAGNTFRIEPDQSMDVFYLKGERYSPWELYVRIYDNGEDVTEYLMNHGKHYVIRENNWVHPDGTIIDYRLEGEQNFQTYHFQRSDSSNNSCSILKNDSDIGNAEQVWKRHYHKVSEQ